MTKKKIGSYPTVKTVGDPRVCILEGILADPVKTGHFTKAMKALRMRLVVGSNGASFDIRSY